MRRRLAAVAAIICAATLLSSQPAPAEGFFDFLFGGGPQKQQRQPSSPGTSFFADPFGLNQPAPPPPRPVASGGSGRGAGYCVRSCDGRYFPLQARGGMSPAQLCQAFCPASAARVFFGSTIDNAVAGNGQRYADSDNAFAYRKALKADCTCNGRDPAGLATIDINTDTSLRAGDVVATADGLAAYSGVRLGAGQAAEFTPAADYPGLTSEVRARLGEMKVAPTTAQLAADDEASAPSAPAPAPITPAGLPKAKRAAVN